VLQRWGTVSWDEAGGGGGTGMSRKAQCSSRRGALRSKGARAAKAQVMGLPSAQHTSSTLGNHSEQSITYTTAHPSASD